MDITITQDKQAQIRQCLWESIGLPVLSDETGLIVAPDAKREVDYYQPVWFIDDKVIIRANEKHANKIYDAIKDISLSVDSVSASLDGDNRDIITMRFYTLIADEFQPFVLDRRYTVRQLTQDDQVAFDAFLEKCSAEDREDADVSLDRELAFGVLDGERIVAAANTYIIFNMVDIGVIADPAYRKQGLGKAVVSAVCEHYLQTNESRVVMYRHATDNHGSYGIARALNFQLFAEIVYIKYGES